ncbi:MAG: repressor LexA [Myxococcales bacterium]|nr:repressor LexA [Myxococcales bacterium]
MKKLTERQRLVLEFIIDQLDERGYPPTIREIGVHMQIRSTNGVNDHLKALERKGYLVRDESKSRALRPLFSADGTPLQTSAPVTVQNVPLVGRIAAGNPIEAIQHSEETITVGEGLLGKSKEIFALRVKGESMIEDGILDGDIIFVGRQLEADQGDITAVMVDGEATVKRYYREEGRIRLQPANSTMEPIYINDDEFLDTQILGKVLGVFRQL